MSNSNHSAPVLATLVPHSQYLPFVKALFGRHTEAVKYIYWAMEELRPNSGSLVWRCYELSNGGRFMAPLCEDPVMLTRKAVGVSGSVSVEAAGILATILGIAALFTSGVMGSHEADDLTDTYYALMEYVSQHRESEAIHSFIG